MGGLHIIGLKKHLIRFHTEIDMRGEIQWRTEEKIKELNERLPERMRNENSGK